MKTLIMKFGGASVQNPESFSKISDLIIERSQHYQHIVIVVSAMGDMTDYLIELAHKVNPNPPPREYDMLVSVGERISISLLAMALDLKGKQAVSFTGSQSGIITCSNHGEALIVDIKPHRLIPHLQSGKCVIVAGFQGVSRNGEITTLGRGGSDTTAVALGVALKAEKVEFFKDVAGIFDDNPKVNPSAHPYPLMNYQQALEVVMKTGGQVLHPRCIQLAKKNFLPLHVLSFQKNSCNGTIIDEPEIRLHPINSSQIKYESD